MKQVATPTPPMDPVTAVVLSVAIVTFGAISWYLALGTMAASGRMERARPT